MQKTLQEIGTIKDIKGQTWDVFAQIKISSRFGGDEMRNLVLELHASNGELLETITARSLAEIPTQFSQQAINAMESDFQDKQIEGKEEYLKDLRNERGV